MSSPLTNLVAVGAHGRDYRSGNIAALQRDWEAGAEFKICNGPYFSKVDVQRLLYDGWTHITFMARDGLRVAIFDLQTQQFDRRKSRF